MMNRIVFTGYCQKAHRGKCPDLTFESDCFVGHMRSDLERGFRRAFDDPELMSLVIYLTSPELGTKVRTVKFVRADVGWEVGLYPAGEVGGPMPHVHKYNGLYPALDAACDWLYACEWRK